MANKLQRTARRIARHEFKRQYPTFLSMTRELSLMDRVKMAFKIILKRG